MKRRVICALLAALILVSLFPATVFAAPSMTTSDKAVAILKRWEGFSPTAYWDVKHYSIGYGTSCDKDEFPNGITRAEAETLLRQYLVSAEAAVNGFASKNGLTLTQAQFDALILFSYNLGAGWISGDSAFKSAVIAGKTGNEMINRFVQFCKAGGEVKTSLINRRLTEADLYLNGYYGTTAPSSYSYVLLDPNGGVCSTSAVGYDAMDPVALKDVPTYTGYRFLGWYTKKDGGQWVTTLDATTKGATLYAHWQKDDGPEDNDGNPTGTAASYTRKVTGTALEVVYVGAENKMLTDGEEITIVKDYVREDGVKFGILADGGWVNLTDSYVTAKADEKNTRTEVEVEKEEDITGEGVRVTVTGDYVNYRSGHSTNYTKLGRLYYGDQVWITETYGTGGNKCGKFSKGWVCLRYTNYDSVMMNGGSNMDDMIAEGMVRASSLVIRKEPSSKSERLGTLKKDTYVEIIEVKTAEGLTWGNIGKGWIALDYVNWAYILPEEPVTPPADSVEPENPDTPENPENPETPENPSTEETGTVVASALRIRKEPTTNASTLDYYRKGDKVTILEKKKVNSTVWGRTDKGWISLSYVKLDNPTTTPPATDTPTTPPATDTPTTPPATDTPTVPPATDTPAAPTGGLTGVVTAGLNIRAGAGKNFAVVGTYIKGTKVTVTEQKISGGITWGKTDKGWICLSYVRVDAGSGSVMKNGKVTASALCIRSAPGTENAIVGRYKKGTVILILETVKVGKVTWGRTDLGWVSMQYVK